MICCCGLFHFQKVPEPAAWSPLSLDAITTLHNNASAVMRDQPDFQQINITSADTIRLQHSEVLTVQCSRANGGSGQKFLTLCQPRKKPPDDWLVCRTRGIHREGIRRNTVILDSVEPFRTEVCKGFRRKSYGKIRCRTEEMPGRIPVEVNGITVGHSCKGLQGSKYDGSTGTIASIEPIRQSKLN